MLEVQSDLEQALEGVDAVVLTVRHAQYKALDADWVVDRVGQAHGVVDCFGILPDDKIVRYLERGCAVRGVARGHVRRLKAQLDEDR